MAESCCGVNTDKALDQQQKRLLYTVLVINAVMFVVEFVAGWLAQSSGLLADSLDMLADALVYSASLYAVGKTAIHKANAALLNGSLQLLLGSLVLIDVGQRLIFGSQPEANTMLWIAGLALVANVICFLMLFSHRNGDINIRSSWICSRNDMLMNTGVIVSAIAVKQSGYAWPDLLIATVIALVVVNSVIGIIRQAKQVKRGERESVSSCCG